MAFSRYVRTPILNLGSQFGTPRYAEAIRKAISDGTIQTEELIITSGDRLDTLAGMIYGDGRYWWILAASSNIGWGLQVPAGTVVKIPKLSDVASIIG